jgi:hypothetical protein
VTGVIATFLYDYFELKPQRTFFRSSTARQAQHRSVPTDSATSVASVANTPPVVRPATLSGTWVGTAGTGTGLFYPYQWTIEQDGEKIRGTISISDGNGQTSAVYRIRGVFQSDVLRFEGVEFVQKSGGSWCMASGVVRLRTLGGTSRLEGNWGPLAVAGGCPPGTGGTVQLARR